MDSLTLNANPIQCLTKQHEDEKCDTKERAEKRRECTYLSESCRKQEEEIQVGSKRKKIGSLQQSETVENKNY